MKDLVEVFSRILESERTSHAYILEGSSPAQRIQEAERLSMLLLCMARHTDTSAPCGECISCKKVLARVHPDLILIEPVKDLIRIDQIKDLVSGLKYPPLEGQVRCIIIQEAQKMNSDAANTLLKTLEEPPSNNIFFLTVGSIDQLLPTIVSRCQRLSVGVERISPYAVEAPTELSRFELYVNEVTVNGIEDNESSKIIEKRNRIFEILSLYYERGKEAAAISNAFQLSKDSAQERQDFFELLLCLKVLARDLLLIKTVGNDAELDNLLINNEYKDFLIELSGKFHESDLCQYSFQLSELENMARRGINLEYAGNFAILFWFGEHGKDRTS
ncbi:ATP-binding protein [Dissulfuribacter thermophilus]|nr:DNA polymerase III subunit delta' [Dissulfuribacter thermophilus]